MTQAQQRAEKEFCKNSELDRRSLNECHQLVQELKKRLFKLGISEKFGRGRTQWSAEEKGIDKIKMPNFSKQFTLRQKPPKHIY